MRTIDAESYVPMMKQEFPHCPICENETEYFVWKHSLSSGVECKHCGARWSFHRKVNWKGQAEEIRMSLEKPGKFNVTVEVMSLLRKWDTPLSRWKTLKRGSDVSVPAVQMASQPENLGPEHQSSVSASSTIAPSFSDRLHEQDAASLSDALIFDHVSYWGGDKKVLSRMDGDILVTRTDVSFVQKGPLMKDNKKLLKKFVIGELDKNSDDCLKFLSRISNPIIHVPINGIDIDGLQYNVGVDVRRQGVSLVTGIWGAGGEKRTTYFFVTIPYIDKDGVHQTPKFFVDRQGGKRLHKEIYERVLNARRSPAKANMQISGDEKPVKADDDALKLLKIRLAKGEITAQEYQEKKLLIEQ